MRSGTKSVQIVKAHGALVGPVLKLIRIHSVCVHDCLKSLLFGPHLFFQILDRVDCLRFCHSLGSLPFLNFPRKGNFIRCPVNVKICLGLTFLAK